jgi:PAS domain S-box-containing protein
MLPAEPSLVHPPGRSDGLAPPDFRALFESAPELCLVLTPELRIVAASDAYLEATKTERRDIMGRRMFEVFLEDPAGLGASLARVLAHRTSDTVAVRHYGVRRPGPASGGAERHFNAVNSPVFGPTGEITYILHRIEDVTEAVQRASDLQEANRQLREANAKHQAIFDQGLFAGLLAPDGTLIDANRSSLESCGFTRDDVIGKPFWETGWWNRSPALQAWIKAGFAEALAGRPFRGESPYFVADGSERIVDFALASIKDETGQVVYVVPTGMDVTDQRRAEQSRVEAETARQASASEQQRRVYEAALSNTADFNYVFDLDGRFTFVNSRLLALWQRDASEALGKNFFELDYPPELAARLHRQIREVIETKQPVRDETPFTSAVGERQYEYIFVPVFGASGAVEAVTGSTRDITERKEIEEALRRSERRLAAALAASGTGTFVWSIQTGELEWDENLDRLFGLAPGQTPRTIDEFLRMVHPDERADVRRRCEWCAREGTDFDMSFRVLWPDDSVHWITDRGKVFKDEQGRSLYMTGACVDVTEHQQAQAARRESEERLRVSEARFRIFAEGGPQMIWAADAKGRSEYVNPRWCEYTGLTREQTADPEYLGRVIHPDDFQGMMDRWNAAYASGTAFEAEFRLRRAADGAYRWFLCRGVPVRDGYGRIVQWVGANADIDDQKRAEEQLKEADRRKTYFLALLAHELRNPLAPIRNGLQIMRRPETDPAALGEAVEMMERQVGQMVRLVDDLLDVARITQNKIELRKERIELSTAIRRAVEISRPLIEARGHDLRVSLAAVPAMLEADMVRLAQIVSNLLNNSARYTPNGGRIEVITETQEGEAVVRVRDNGTGIPAAMLPTLFDMFTQGDQRQERAHGGLGLGLSLVKSLVQLHGGTVDVASPEEGQGSEFTVRLPLAPRAEPLTMLPLPGAGLEARRAPWRRRILVVDDNRDSSESLAILLQIMGHEVHIAYDGPNALESARTHHPDTVLLDIGLPGMSGHTVARRMRQELHMTGTLLVAMTGWGQEEDRKRSREAGFDHHLVKPVEPNALEALLASSAHPDR